MVPRYSLQSGAIKAGESHIFRSGRSYLMILLTNGSGYVVIGDIKYACTTTEMILLKPRTAQTLFPAGPYGSCAFWTVRVSPEALDFYSDDTCDLVEKYSFVPYQTAIIHGGVHAVTTLKSLLSRLSALGQEEQKLGLSLYQNSLLSLFLILFLRACAQSDQVRRKQKAKNLPMDDVFRFIHGHLAEDLSLQRLEKEFYVSGEHISRMFKKAAGISLHAYITKSRIDLSKKYILQGDPIKEVFSRCGFGSYNHFFKAFKKECGMTPKEYFGQASDIIRSV